jgi:hypothetical protein
VRDMTGYIHRHGLEALLADDDSGTVVTYPKGLARLRKFLASAGVPDNATTVTITLGLASRGGNAKQRQYFIQRPPPIEMSIPMVAGVGMGKLRSIVLVVRSPVFSSPSVRVRTNPRTPFSAIRSKVAPTMTPPITVSSC